MSKTKDRIGEYWKAIAEGVVSTILLYVIMSQNSLGLFIGIMLILTDIIILLYSTFKLEDPKMLIVFLITECLTKNS